MCVQIFPFPPPPRPRSVVRVPTQTMLGWRTQLPPRPATGQWHPTWTRECGQGEAERATSLEWARVVMAALLCSVTETLTTLNFHCD